MSRVTLILVSITFFASWASTLHAQFGPEIQSGRPGQAIGSGTVGRQVFQVQTGPEFNSSIGLRRATAPSGPAAAIC